MSIKDQDLAAAVIEALGGTGAAAQLCDVTPGAVSQWRLNGIPKSQLRFLRLARPEVFVAPEVAATLTGEPHR